MAGKVIIISAPSGCGKSTIINALMGRGDLDLLFSVSATNRPPREGEEHGVNYFFLSTDRFKSLIDDDAFVEYEEVYPGRFYGTLKSEVERITSAGHNVILDIDVKGGVNVKRLYGDKALALFIEPPSVAALKERLLSRGTDPLEAIEQRVAKAEYELTFADKYDTVIVNDDLTTAIDQTHSAIQSFTK